MDTDGVCQFCGLQASPETRAAMTSENWMTATSSFLTSLRNSAWTGRRLRTLLWTYVFCLILVSNSAWGQQRPQRFEEEPRNDSVTEGRTVVLNCRISNRKGGVQWTQDRMAFGIDRPLPGYPRHQMIGAETGDAAGGTIGEWNLQIRNVSLEDDGEYQCQAGATAVYEGIRSRSAFLEVVVPPSDVTIDEGRREIPVVLHRPTNITCRANRGKPAADISWYMNGVRITEKVYSRSQPRPDQKLVDTIGMVTINATKTDAGKLINCEAIIQRFMENPLRASATLDVQYAPEITLSVNLTRTIREYDYVRFTCAGVANPTEITWRWFRNNLMLEGETSHLLIVHQISHDYNGDTISCTASNRVGRTRREMTLSVLYGPRITAMAAVVGADLGREAALTCTVDGNPTPHTLWTRKDRGSPTPHTLSTASTYTIDAVNRGSFGVYVCTASSNGFPDASKDILLLQNGRPSIRSEAQQYASGGENGKLECIAHSVPKPDRMLWLRDGRPIDYATSGRFSSEERDLLYGRTNILHILNVQKEDFGVYNCNVVNSYGSDNATLTLVEKSVPPLPYIIGGAVGGVAALFIIALACVLYQRYKREDSGSVLGSTTDTDSSADKKRKDADSPSTLMDQWRQDYNKKDFYRYSADYDELNYKEGQTGNNNAYGCLEPGEPYRESNTLTRERAMTPLERYEAVYGPSAYSMSSFRGREHAALDMGDAKLATDV